MAALELSSARDRRRPLGWFRSAPIARVALAATMIAVIVVTLAAR